MGECSRLCLFTTNFTSEGPGSDFTKKMNKLSI